MFYVPSLHPTASVNHPFPKQPCAMGQLYSFQQGCYLQHMILDTARDRGILPSTRTSNGFIRQSSSVQTGILSQSSSSLREVCFHLHHPPPLPFPCRRQWLAARPAIQGEVLKPLCSLQETSLNAAAGAGGRNPLSAVLTGSLGG